MFVYLELKLRNYYIRSVLKKYLKIIGFRHEFSKSKNNFPLLSNVDKFDQNITGFASDELCSKGQ